MGLLTGCNQWACILLLKGSWSTGSFAGTLPALLDSNGTDFLTSGSLGLHVEGVGLIWPRATILRVLDLVLLGPSSTSYILMELSRVDWLKSSLLERGGKQIVPAISLDSGMLSSLDPTSSSSLLYIKKSEGMITGPSIDEPGTRVGNVWNDEAIHLHNKSNDSVVRSESPSTQVSHKLWIQGFYELFNKRIAWKVWSCNDRSSDSRPPSHIHTPVLTDFQTFADDRKSWQTKIGIWHWEEWYESGGKALTWFLRNWLMTLTTWKRNSNLNMSETWGIEFRHTTRCHYVIDDWGQSKFQLGEDDAQPTSLTPEICDYYMQQCNQGSR